MNQRVRPRYTYPIESSLHGCAATLYFNIHRASNRRNCRFAKWVAPPLVAVRPDGVGVVDSGGGLVVVPSLVAAHAGTCISRGTLESGTASHPGTGFHFCACPPDGLPGQPATKR